MELKERIKSLKKWDLVSVEWEDVFCRFGAQHSSLYIEAYEPCIRKTAGYYLGSKAGRIFIAETDDRTAGVDDCDCESVTTLPLAYIIKIQ